MAKKETALSKEEMQLLEKDIILLKRVQRGVFGDLNSAFSVFFSILKETSEKEEKWSIFNIDDKQKNDLNKKFIKTFLDATNNFQSLAWIRNLGIKPPYNLKNVIDVKYTNFVENILLKNKIIDEERNIIHQNKWNMVKDFTTLPISKTILEKPIKYFELYKKTNPELENSLKLDWNKIEVSTKKWKPTTTQVIKLKLENITNKKFEVNPFELDYLDVK